MNSWSKYFFVVINVLFLVIGALLLGFSIWLQYASPIHEVLVLVVSSKLMTYGILVIGILVLFMGLCGVLGGIMENKGWLATYLFFNVAFLISEICILGLGVSNKEIISTEVANIWGTLELESKYLIQNKFNCCGYGNASEWGGDIPTSCIDQTQTNSTVIWQVGCSTSIIKWIEENALYFGIALGVVVALEIFLVTITAYLLFLLGICPCCRKAKLKDSLMEEDPY